MDTADQRLLDLVRASGQTGVWLSDVAETMGTSRRHASRTATQLEANGQIVRRPNTFGKIRLLAAEHADEVQVPVDEAEVWAEAPFKHRLASAADTATPAGLGPRWVFDIAARR